MKTVPVDFYFVFSTWNEPNKTAYHLTVRDVAETMDEVEKIGGSHRDRVLSMAQSSKEGFDVSVIEKFINTDLASAHADLKVKHEKLQAQMENAPDQDRINALVAENTALRQRADAAIYLPAPPESPMLPYYVIAGTSFFYLALYCALHLSGVI